MCVRFVQRAAVILTQDLQFNCSTPARLVPKTEVSESPCSSPDATRSRDAFLYIRYPALFYKQRCNDKCYKLADNLFCVRGKWRFAAKLNKMSDWTQLVVWLQKWRETALDPILLPHPSFMWQQYNPMYGCSIPLFPGECLWTTRREKTIIIPNFWRIQGWDWRWERIFL